MENLGDEWVHITAMSGMVGREFGLSTYTRLFEGQPPGVLPEAIPSPDGDGTMYARMRYVGGMVGNVTLGEASLTSQGKPEDNEMASFSSQNEGN